MMLPAASNRAHRPAICALVSLGLLKEALFRGLVAGEVWREELDGYMTV